MPLVQLIFVIIGAIIVTTDKLDNIIRRWFGLEKLPQREKSFRKPVVWIELFILLVFAVIYYLIGMVSHYKLIVIFLFGVIFFGFQAIADKKYINESKEYLVTLFLVIVKTLLFMIVVAISY